MPETTDSITPRDTIAQTPAPFTLPAEPGARDTTLCREDDAPWSAREQNVCIIGRVPYTEGLTPQPRHVLPGYDSGVMALVIGVFVLITLNFRHYSTFLKTFTQNLFSVRKRANVFDERSTVSETRVLLSLILLLCLSEGILLFSFLQLHGITMPNLAGIGSLSALAAAYYLLQLATYRTVGYVFTTRARAVMWVKGFNASQSLLGICIAPPALLALFNPAITPTLLSISVILYAVARIIFIYKGFRIFYNNFLALIYFILYLCSLEIIPLILLYKASLFLTSFL